MPKRRTSILFEKWREALTSVLPITLVVFFLCFFFIPVPVTALMGFIIGAAFIIIGMGLFTLGSDLAMSPIGRHVGAYVTRSRKLWVAVFVGLLVGILITLSEPDLQVLAEQVPGVPNLTLMLAVAIGVGIFLVVALLRILLQVKMSHLLLLFYGLVFLLSFFVPRSFLAVAFDSGGVTTGPMTVPFILALGVGVSSMRNDSGAEDDSFGLVALCSIGPILAVMILGLIYQPQEGLYSASTALPTAETSTLLWKDFILAFPKYLEEAGIALLPIVVFFLVLNFTKLHLEFNSLMRILMGVGATYVGLVLFLLGVNVGFMPVGHYIGKMLGSLSARYVLIPLGMVIGYFVVAAEPAVHVLNRQVYEITSGAIPPKALQISLSISVAVSVGLAMLRIITGMPILYLLVPGYAIALVLMFFTPRIFTAIAFDSGGVASGPMTATFLLPLAMGACTAMGGDVAADAFGVVAMVAMTPLITIQVLGVIMRVRQRRQDTAAPRVPETAGSQPQEDIIEL